jgi:hypothetical protein
VNYAVSKQNKMVEKYGSVYQIAAPAFTLTKKLYFTHYSRRAPSHQRSQQLLPAARSHSAALANAVPSHKHTDDTMQDQDSQRQQTQPS